MSRHDKAAVLVSGGLDSAVLLAETAFRYRRVYPIYSRQGLHWEKAELYWLRRFLRALKLTAIQPVKLLALPMQDLYGAHWSTTGKKVPGSATPDRAVYLPGRNLALSVKAGVFCAQNRIPVLLLGSLGHNPFPDATPKFFREWGRAMGLGLGKPLMVAAPFRSLTKAKVIQRGSRWPLELTFSCIAPRGLRHCGRCNKCAERRRAFRAARVPDKTAYAS